MTAEGPESTTSKPSSKGDKSAMSEENGASSTAKANPRRVSFHSSAKAQDGTADPFGGDAIPRRIKLRKSASPLRDAFFLFSFVGLLLYLSQTSDMGPTKDGQPRKRNKIALADEINKLQRTVQTMMMEATEKTRRKEGCDLFVSMGSIPHTGLAPFAGRRYLKGEIIYESTATAPIEMPDGSVEHISSLAFLLKFHPTLSNVENIDTLGAMKLRATRAIKTGEELFLPFEQHPLHVLPAMKERQLFGHIPSKSDYELAESLQNEIKVTARRMEVAHQRRIQDSITLNTGYLYSLGAEITGHFAPNVAKLLPSSRADVHARGDTPLQLAALGNQTLANLQLRGSCLGDVKLETGDNSNDGSVAFEVVATRSVTKNEVLQTVPVHLFKSSHSSHPNCFSSKGIAWNICPLTDIVKAPAASAKEANVMLKWSEEKDLTRIIESAVEEVRAGTVALDLVALEPIGKAEKLILQKPMLFEGLASAEDTPTLPESSTEL